MNATITGGALSRADKFYVYRPLLDLIGLTEGTDKSRGYNETLAYGKFTGGDVSLVAMTLPQLDALQTKMLQHPANKWNSSAAGRYQIVRTTARAIRERLPNRYPDNRRFDADCQDEMACYLLGLRGIDKYLTGRLSEDGLINNLAQEWASLPTTKDKGHYGGQHAFVKSARVREVLGEVKRRHVQGQPETVSIDKPVVPVRVEEKVKEKSNLLTWLTGGGGLGTIGLGWISGMRWDAIVAGGVVLVVVLLLLVLLRTQIIAAVREIKSEIG